MSSRSGNNTWGRILRYRAAVAEAMKPIRRAVVTGGAGFVGSHLCERLLAEGCEVVCLDNFLTSTGENIAHLKPNPGFTFIHHDITKRISIDRKSVV